MSDLTHFDARGHAHMVDVAGKAVTARVAVAGARVRMAPETLARIREGTATKGDVLGVARLAGIQAAKRTGDLIPLCHPLPLEAAAVDFAFVTDPPAVDIYAMAKTSGRTGVEMEAMTAAGVAGLTIYDMCKAVDRAMVIDGVRLLYKTGGKSGTYVADGVDPETLPGLDAP